MMMYKVLLNMCKNLIKLVVQQIYLSISIMIFNLESITESTQNILDTTDSTTKTPISAVTTEFMKTKRSTTTQFSNILVIPRTSDESTIATTKISDIHVQHTRSTPPRLSHIKAESTSNAITSTINIEKMTFDTITKPKTTMKTTTRKIPTHIKGKTLGTVYKQEVRKAMNHKYKYRG